MQTQNKYEDMLPNSRLMYSLREIEERGLIKVSMQKKLLSQGLLESIKVGTKHFITRVEILRYLVANTVSRVDIKDIK